MKKKLLILTLAAALLLAGCNNGGEPAEETTTAPDNTTSNVSALEGAPEDTTVPVTTEPEYTGDPDIDTPDGFPVPYPVGTIEDEETLKTFKEVIAAGIETESILYGFDAEIPLLDLVDGDYYLIDPTYADTKTALSDKIGLPFASYYWGKEYDTSLDYLLYEDTSLGGDTRVKYIDDQLCFFKAAAEKQIAINVDTCVITYLKGDYGTVLALGTLGDKYYWKTYDMINGYNGWVVESCSVEEVSGEIALFTQLLIDDASTLGKIFGDAEPVLGDNGKQVVEYVQIEDDPYGHGFYNALEIEPFMTIEQMKAFLRNTFTSEIAESYISLYVNRTFIEKDGRLFMIDGSLLPKMGTFDIADYENYSKGDFDVTSYLNWTDDDDNTMKLPITIAYEDGVWKLDTRLPMCKDRIITA